jgi:tetratricopeptide (TPR) repeat protein
MYYKFEINLAQLQASMYCRFLLFLISFLLVGCSFVPNELKLAEKLAEDNPDSCLHILRDIKPAVYNTPSNRALYGLLMFEALDAADRPMQPDSLINYSIAYYQSKKDNANLAKCYFYNGHKFKHNQQYETAAQMYILALDCLQQSNDYLLLGKIYADKGTICYIQYNYKEALRLYKLSLEYYNRAGNRKRANYSVLSIGKVYHILKKYKIAQQNFKNVLTNSHDSMLLGAAYQEIGISYYRSSRLDSGELYLRKSLKYPHLGYNYAIRCFSLADLLFDLEKFDSAYCYAAIALENPGNFYLKRDCNRILVNVEYLRNNIVDMGKYMTKYQDYTDSIHKIETQTKSTVLDSLHTKGIEASGAKSNMVWIVSVLFLILFVVICIAFLLFRRDKDRKLLLAAYKQELNSKQEFLNQNVSKKIVEVRELQAGMRKNASHEERIKLDRELYEKSLHLNDWETFSYEMNHTFNQIIDVLKTNYAGITQKEIMWCCFQLLEIPHVDRILLLDATSDSLYKMKQRLANKLNLKSTKDLDLFLKELANKER